MRTRLVGVIGIAALTSCLLTAGYAFKVDEKDKISAKNTNSIKDSSAIAATLTGDSLYTDLDLAAKGLKKDIFLKAWHGFQALNAKGLVKKSILTIADMSQPSCRKRLYIIDALTKKLLINTLVAHGRNSGDRMATRFSNISESLQTSLGFYVTGATYEGNNGYSMRLKGMERGFNDQAESRAIVMHGAPYVSDAIAQTGRIGRSWGCPAVSQKEHRTIIDLVKNGSCLFVFAPEKKYLAQSLLANNEMAQL